MLKCCRPVGKEIAFVINMEPYSLIIAADPQAVLGQGIIRAVSIMGVKSFFIVNGMLLCRFRRRRTARVSAFARLSFAFIS